MRRKSRKKKILIIAGILLLIFVILFGGKIIKGSSILFGILFNRDIELKEEEGAVNILLMGIGGGTHEGPELTDTVIVANINQEKNTVNLISIPRDLWVPELQHKVNFAYAVGQNKNKQGLLLSRKMVEQVTGIPINYSFVIDFSGFEMLVDHIGGVDVDVKRTLDDPEYPVAGKENDACGHTEEEIGELSAQISTGSASEVEAFPCRYQTLYFEKGMHHMNGVDALRFVRSRHAKGAEGTDFARSQRQQQVIQAIRDRALSLGIILNPVKVIGIYDIVKDNINTDITTDEIDDFVKLAQKMQGATIRSYVINQGDEIQGVSGLLEHPDITEEYNYQWVLIPRTGNGNYTEIQDYVECIVKGNECVVASRGITINPTKTPAPSPTR